MEQHWDQIGIMKEQIFAQFFSMKARAWANFRADLIFPSWNGWYNIEIQEI